MITYFMGTTSAYGIALSANSISAHKLDRSPKEISKLVNNFRHAILDFTLPEESTSGFVKEYTNELSANENYVKSAGLLYDILIVPFEQQVKEVKSLLIIPDGELNYLPFDALLTNTVDDDVVKRQDWSSFPFLGKKTSVAYCYSATMLDIMKKNKPFKPQEPGLHVFHLTDFNSQVEAIERIVNQFPVRILGQDATRKTFMEESANYSMLHFSVHGVVNDNSPSLSYLEMRKETNEEEHYIYLSDIYGQPLPASFVFASVCEAGLGKGEGLISLTRGFAYSGAKSMVTTI